MPEPTVAEVRDADMQSLLDEELGRLPGHYRALESEEVGKRELWMKHLARNLTTADEGFLLGKRYPETRGRCGQIQPL